MDGNKHYIRIDLKLNIIYGFSDAFEQPKSTDICINENGERHFELNGVINISLSNSQGIYLFKYINSEIIPKTEDEINHEISILPPVQKTEIELLKEENEKLTQNITSLNEDFVSFMDFYFSSNPE